MIEQQDFGMFTDAGDQMIGKFVEFARTFQLNDKSINECLWAISENEAYAEASDTVVRENVFAALNRVDL